MLYTCNAENRQVDKSKNLIEVMSLDGTLRETNVSVTDPVINIVSGPSIFKANYAYIPDFNRYYFINGFSNIVNGVVSVNMHVDVLMSFKDEFLDNNGYVDASLLYGNFYLNDPNTPVQQNSDLFVVKQFASPFSSGHSSLIMNCLNTSHKITTT